MYRGDLGSFSMRIAHEFAGETNLELIEPLDVPNVYHDHLEAHGEGIHHLKPAWDDGRRIYEVIQVLREAGIQVVQIRSCKASEFWYFDTTDVVNGLMFEASIRRNEAGWSPEFIYL